MRISYKFGPVVKTRDGFEVNWKRNKQIRRAIRVQGPVITHQKFLEVVDAALEPDGLTWKQLGTDYLMNIWESMVTSGQPEWFSLGENTRGY